MGWSDRFLNPPKNEAKVVAKCSACLEPIYEGQRCYHIEDDFYCGECIDNFREIAEDDSDTEGDLVDVEYDQRVYEQSLDKLSDGTYGGDSGEL